MLDLLLFNRGRRFGEEIKRMDARSLTGSMRIALANLQHQHLTASTSASNLYDLAPEVTDYSDHVATNQRKPGVRIPPGAHFISREFMFLAMPFSAIR